MQYSYFAGIGWARWSDIERLWVCCEALTGLEESQGRVVLGFLKGSVIVVYRQGGWGANGGSDCGIGDGVGGKKEVFEVRRRKAA